MKKKFNYIATGKSETEKEKEIKMFWQNVVDNCDLEKMFKKYYDEQEKYGELFHTCKLE